MGADAGVKPHEAYQMISDAVDLLVQIGIRHEVRRVTAISNVAKDLKNGDVFFEPIYRYIEESSATEPRWEQLNLPV
jgi:pilus assembly protein CpaF